jgi:hypothetical protein
MTNLGTRAKEAVEAKEAEALKAEALKAVALKALKSLLLVKSAQVGRAVRLVEINYGRRGRLRLYRLTAQMCLRTMTMWFPCEREREVRFIRGLKQVISGYIQ